jgi:hypothetical protein
MDLYRRLFEMEVAPNQMNIVASLIDDLNILRHLSPRSLFSCKYVCRS